VSPEEDKYLVEIEKLIKRSITKEPFTLEAVNVKSTQADREKPSTQSQSRNSPSRAPQAKSDASTQYKRPANKKHDPWFDQPYESNQASVKDKAQLQAITRNRKSPVAALLGGLRNQKT
jgi:hypothetical protein